MDKFELEQYQKVNNKQKQYAKQQPQIIKNKKHIKIISAQKISNLDKQIISNYKNQEHREILTLNPEPQKINISSKGILSQQQNKQVNKKNTAQITKIPQRKIIENYSYFKQNEIYIKSSIDIDPIIQSLRKVNIFNNYNDLKIKSSEQNTNIAKKLIDRITKEYQCKLAKEKISQTGILFTLEKINIQKQAVQIQIKQKKIQIIQISNRYSEQFKQQKKQQKIQSYKIDEHKNNQPNKRPNQNEITKDLNKQSNKLSYKINQNKLIILKNLTNQDKQLLFMDIQQKKKYLTTTFNRIRICAPKLLQTQARDLSQQIRLNFKWKKNNTENLSESDQLTLNIDLVQQKVQSQKYQQKQVQSKIYQQKKVIQKLQPKDYQQQNQKPKVYQQQKGKIYIQQKNKPKFYRQKKVYQQQINKPKIYQQKKIQSQIFLNLKTSNRFTLLKQTNLNLLIQQLKSKIKQIFGDYTRFMFMIEEETPDQKISEFIMKLQQIKELTIEKIKTDQHIQTIILTQNTKNQYNITKK